MTMRTILATILVGLGLPAAAEFTTIEQAYEVPLTHFRVPASVNATVTFRECAECVEFAARVTPDTQYIVNGTPMLLTDFRKLVFTIRDRESTIFVVRRHLSSNTITAIKATL